MTVPSNPLTESEKLLAAKRSYESKPTLRKAANCEKILQGAIGLGMFANYVIIRLGKTVEASGDEPLVAGAILRVGESCIMLMCAGVILICGVVLTGPVYKKQLDFSRGELDTWGTAHKCAAIVLSCVFGAIAFFVGRLMIRAIVQMAQ